MVTAFPALACSSLQSCQYLCEVKIRHDRPRVHPGTVPSTRRTSQASVLHFGPPEGAPLLLQGMAMSTVCRGESVLHRAMEGRLVQDASVTGWWSALRSVTTQVWAPGRLPGGLQEGGDRQTHRSPVPWLGFTDVRMLMSAGFSMTQRRELPAEASLRCSSGS